MAIYLNEDSEVEVGGSENDKFIYYDTSSENYKELYLPIIKWMMLFNNVCYVPIGIIIHYEKIDKAIWMLLPVLRGK